MNTLQFDAGNVRNFIECVINDEQSKEHGLWQGKMPPRILEAAKRVEDAVSPVSVYDRRPDINESVLAWCRVHNEYEVTHIAICDALPSSPTGRDPEFDGWVGDSECRFTHWLPMLPKPECE